MSTWRDNIERVRAGYEGGQWVTKTEARAALDALTAQMEELERERDALFAAISAEPPDDKTVRYFQKLHGLPEVGLIGDAARAEAAELRCSELWTKAHRAEQRVEELELGAKRQGIRAALAEARAEKAEVRLGESEEEYQEAESRAQAAEQREDSA